MARRRVLADLARDPDTMLVHTSPLGPVIPDSHAAAVSVRGGRRPREYGQQEMECTVSFGWDLATIMMRTLLLGTGILGPRAAAVHSRRPHGSE